MTTNVWKRAQTVSLQVADDIRSEFDIGFDKRIPQDVQQTLRAFVEWAEVHYRFPVTLWVDFEYKHYLIRRDGKRVGYLFYWSDFSSYPVFDNLDDIPKIRLPVRTEHSTVEDILRSFCEAITCYFAWICNEICEGTPTTDDADEILEEYLSFRQSTAKQH